MNALLDLYDDNLETLTLRKSAKTIIDKNADINVPYVVTFSLVKSDEMYFNICTIINCDILNKE